MTNSLWREPDQHVLPNAAELLRSANSSASDVIPRVRGHLSAPVSAAKSTAGWCRSIVCLQTSASQPSVRTHSTLNKNSQKSIRD